MDLRKTLKNVNCLYLEIIKEIGDSKEVVVLLNKITKISIEIKSEDNQEH